MIFIKEKRGKAIMQANISGNNTRKNNSPNAAISNSTEMLKSNHLFTLQSLALVLLREIEEMKNEENRLNKVKKGDKIHLYDEVESFEINLIRNALIRTGGHQANAARLLGIKTTTINNKIKRFGIDLNQLEMS